MGNARIRRTSLQAATTGADHVVLDDGPGSSGGHIDVGFATARSDVAVAHHDIRRVDDDARAAGIRDSHPADYLPSGGGDGS